MLSFNKTVSGLGRQILISYDFYSTYIGTEKPQNPHRFEYKCNGNVKFLCPVCAMMPIAKYSSYVLVYMIKSIFHPIVEGSS